MQFLETVCDDIQILCIFGITFLFLRNRNRLKIARIENSEKVKLLTILKYNYEKEI